MKSRMCAAIAAAAVCAVGVSALAQNVVISQVYGGGGYLPVANEWSIPDECSALSDGQIAVFNPGFPLGR